MALIEGLIRPRWVTAGNPYHKGTGPGGGQFASGGSSGMSGAESIPLERRTAFVDNDGILKVEHRDTGQRTNVKPYEITAEEYLVARPGVTRQVRDKGASLGGLGSPEHTKYKGRYYVGRGSIDRLHTDLLKTHHAEIKAALKSKVLSPQDAERLGHFDNYPDLRG